MLTSDRRDVEYFAAQVREIWNDAIADEFLKDVASRTEQVFDPEVVLRAVLMRSQDPVIMALGRSLDVSLGAG